jgi:polyhydroxyalkanoate synthesis regulator phasin
MSIEQKIIQEIDNILADVKAGNLSKEEGTDLLNELKDTQAQLSKVDKEIMARHIVEAVSLVSKLA